MPDSSAHAESSARLPCSTLSQPLDNDDTSATTATLIRQRERREFRFMGCPVSIVPTDRRPCQSLREVLREVLNRSGRTSPLIEDGSDHAAAERVITMVWTG